MQNICAWVKFVYQGHRVKVKVTGAQKGVSVSRSRVICLRLKGNCVIIITINNAICQNVFGCELPSVLLAIRYDKFIEKIVCISV